ncbi:hypothetical protein F4561_003349 [Lipingzhangella halophila]|uniref:Uncharacterized protein n=1 Tax=Lipingzhangella halophila TaxID=1783352 RepID=A0A7W7RIC3_9ACTN|nr:hypothetical protein [Lipingzhangella halophila]
MVTTRWSRWITTTTAAVWLVLIAAVVSTSHVYEVARGVVATRRCTY